MNAFLMATTEGPPDHGPLAGWIKPMGRWKPGPRQKSDLKRLWEWVKDRKQGKHNIDDHRYTHILSIFPHLDNFYLLGLEGWNKLGWNHQKHAFFLIFWGCQKLPKVRTLVGFLYGKTRPFPGKYCTLYGCTVWYVPSTYLVRTPPAVP